MRMSQNCSLWGDSPSMVIFDGSNENDSRKPNTECAIARIIVQDSAISVYFSSFLATIIIRLSWFSLVVTSRHRITVVEIRRLLFGRIQERNHYKYENTTDYGIEMYRLRSGTIPVWDFLDFKSVFSFGLQGAVRLGRFGQVLPRYVLPILTYLLTITCLGELCMAR